uniref:Uncharacterized protein n=1 Tax=Kryptolebias marmoratus TaxID=37003 RepID=A0A3Q3BKJ7_KRYMA
MFPLTPDSYLDSEGHFLPYKLHFFSNDKKLCNASVSASLSALLHRLPFLLPPHFRCFSSLSPALPPASPCRLLGGLLRNILSSPLRASVR